VIVSFSGPGAGSGPLTWGQKAILRDMRDSGNQFSMGGLAELSAGSKVEDAVSMLSGLMSRHAALRMHVSSDAAQEVFASGRVVLDVVTVPSDADPALFAADLMASWPLSRFDFAHDWPLRMAVLVREGRCLSLVWALSHLAADGGAHLLLLNDLLSPGVTGRQLLDIARDEQTPQSRQASTRAMRHWEAQLRDIPPQTFPLLGPPTVPGPLPSTVPGSPAGAPAPLTGAPAPSIGAPSGERYWQARFTSPAAHLAMRAIAARTGTDPSRVTLAVIATAIGRAAGLSPLTLKLMVNNRFRPGLADVIAPIAQNSVLTIDAADVSVDEVVARARGAALTAGMRAYYDPDELAELMDRLDTERGYPAAVTLRVNDQRAMIMRPDEPADASDVTPTLIGRRLEESTLTWLGPRHNMHEQANILIENQPGVVSLHMMWDRWCLSDARVEALLRAVEEIFVEAAFNPAAPTKVSPGQIGA
jgi:hypothetical protein